MNRFSKLAIGLGVTGVVVFGASSMLPRPQLLPFDILSTDENAALGKLPELHAAVTRLDMYATLDTKTHRKLVKNAAKLACESTLIPSITSTRKLDNTIANVKRHLATLKRAVQQQSDNNPGVVEDFDDLAENLLDQCESQSFNMHQHL